MNIPTRSSEPAKMKFGVHISSIVLLLTAACAPDVETAKALCLGDEYEGPIGSQVEACTVLIEQPGLSENDKATYYAARAHFLSHGAAQAQASVAGGYRWADPVYIYQAIKRAILLRDAEDDLDDALADAKIAFAIAPKNALTNRVLGGVYLAKKDFYNAVVYLDSAVRINPEILRAQYHLGLGYLYRERERGTFRLQSAIDHLTRAVELAPEKTLPWKVLADAYLRRMKEPLPQDPPTELVRRHISDAESAYNAYKEYAARAGLEELPYDASNAKFAIDKFKAVLATAKQNERN